LNKKIKSIVGKPSRLFKENIQNKAIHEIWVDRKMFKKYSLEKRPKLKYSDYKVILPKIKISYSSPIRFQREIQHIRKKKKSADL